MTVVGTTDAPSDITMSPAPQEDDVRFILEEANRYLNRKVRGRAPHQRRGAIITARGDDAALLHHL
jgi:hypothetical protein